MAGGANILPQKLEYTLYLSQGDFIFKVRYFVHNIYQILHDSSEA